MCIRDRDNLYRKYDCRMTDLVGQRFYLFGDTTKTYRLGAALQNVRYHDYDHIPANNRLFDTLDTTTRLLTVSDTLDVVISDTVGFIRKLPHQLVEAFKATLEAVSYTHLARQAIERTLRREAKAEELRVLYVAMTRAKEKLVMVHTCLLYTSRGLRPCPRGRWGRTSGTLP